MFCGLYLEHINGYAEQCWLTFVVQRICGPLARNPWFAFVVPVSRQMADGGMLTASVLPAWGLTCSALHYVRPAMCCWDILII